ncbi:MAG: sulfite exporter TauE/SafE family protein, partial [Alphaproteobacteria bacterium]|nr:sulfite exporter TauE/SafE family protein [Alphaproteobacteria bacterium]
MTDTILIAAITFLAALAQGATGFRFAIIAMPLLLSVM